MAAKTGVKAAVKAAAAKPAAAPQSLEGAEKSAAAPGAGASADNTGPVSGESDADKLARETEEQRLEAERQALLDEEEAARLLAVEMGLLEDEARAMDLERTERLKTTQTTAEEGAKSAVTLTGWALPEISEFPATVTLDNNTRNRVAVAGANVALLPYQQAVVEISQEQFAKLAKALTGSARAHKWDNFRGLQVKYDRKD